MQQIPGYYYDETKNRYFRIMPSGPHSLEALRKAKEYSATENRLRSSRRSHQRSIIADRNLYQFCATRRIQNRMRPRTLIDNVNRALYKSLQLHTELSIPSCLSSSTGFMDIDNSNGEAVISYPGGRLMRYGYQCEPFFQMWSASTAWRASSEVSSLHLCYHVYIQGEERRVIIGTTSGGMHNAQLFRYSIPALQPLDPETAKYLCQRAPRKTIRTKQSAAVRTGELVERRDFHSATVDCTLSLKKTSFYSSSVSDKAGIILAGSDHGVHVVTTSFELVNSHSTSSTVMAIETLSSNPGLGWLGCRDGTLQLYDSRTACFCRRFSYSKAAIVHMSGALEHPLLLTVNVNGDMLIWDARWLKSKLRNNKRTEPVRQLTGHEGCPTQNFGFDVDPKLRMVAAAGSDRRIRLWSLAEDQILENNDAPFWISRPFNEGPIRTAKFIREPPPTSPLWWDEEQYPEIIQQSFDGDDYTFRRAPGLLVSAPATHTTREGPAIHWLTIPSSTS